MKGLQMARTAVVFGGKTAGNGQGVADRLARDGFRVVALSHADRMLQPEVADDGSVTVDMGDLDALRSAAAELAQHRPHAVVFADMFFAMEDNEKFDHSLWQKSLAINLTAPNVLFRELAQSAPDGASFVIVTSTEAFMGSFGASAYAATKAAIHNLVKSLANVFGPRGLRFNALAAGWIGGVMDTDEVFNMSRSITPLGRLGTVDEVGAAASFLVGPDSSFVNGAVLVVDGGYSGVDTIAKYEYEAGQSSS
jgi:NAD(P)-dependent dehydrogenase (short-subunit alcohol dehydrogenase family)